MWSWKGRSWCFLSTFHHLLWTPKYSLSSSLHFKHCSIYSGRKQMIWLLLCYSFDPWVTFNLSVWSVFFYLSVWLFYLFDHTCFYPAAICLIRGLEARWLRQERGLTLLDRNRATARVFICPLCFIGHYLAKEDLLGHTHHRESGFNWVNLNFQLHFWIYTVYYTEAD